MPLFSLQSYLLQKKNYLTILFKNILKLYFKYEDKSFRVLVLVGGLLVLKKISYLLIPSCQKLLTRQPLIKKYGKESWAVITGCDQRLSQAFCFELAKRGFSLCIIGPSQIQLKQLKQDIHILNNKVLVHTIDADFKDSLDEHYFDKITSELSGIDISILINNFNQSNARDWNYYQSIAPNIYKELYNSQCSSAAFLTNIIAQKMVQRQNRSAIINITSKEGDFPCPFLTASSTQSSFINTLSNSIAQEFSDKIDVLLYKPASKNIMTIFQNQDEHSLKKQLQNTVCNCLSDLGYYQVSYGNFIDFLESRLLNLVPRFMKVLLLNIFGPTVIAIYQQKFKKLKKDSNIDKVQHPVFKY